MPLSTESRFAIWLSSGAVLGVLLTCGPTQISLVDDTEGEVDGGDVLVPPFTGPLAHHFPQLEAWVQAEQEALRAEIKSTIGLGS